MARQWLSAFLWFCIWAGVYLMVYRWGMWWWAATAFGMTTCAWLLLVRTGALLFLRHPVVRYQPPGPPRRIRRVILEEEEVVP